MYGHPEVSKLFSNKFDYLFINQYYFTKYITAYIKNISKLIKQLIYHI